MGMLAERADHVIGVDTHRDAHSAAAVATATGTITAQTTVAADAFGYKRLLRFARRHAHGRRVWAIESSGSYGAGLATFLLAHGEWVVEVDRPKRAARRNGAKSDELDAIRAARESLAREHLAQPRARGDREAIRVLLITRRGAIRARTIAINHLKALVVTAREELRHQLRNTPTDVLVYRCARLRTLSSHSNEHRATVLALRTPRGAFSRSRPKPTTSRRKLSDSSKTPCPSYWPRSASGRSAPLSSTAPGHTAAACAMTARSRCSAGPRRSPPPPDRPSATASTALATDSSTARCTPSSSPDSSTCLLYTSPSPRDRS